MIKKKVSVIFIAMNYLIYLNFNYLLGKPINITNSIKSDNFKSCLQSNEKFSKHQIGKL